MPGRAGGRARKQKKKTDPQRNAVEHSERMLPKVYISANFSGWVAICGNEMSERSEITQPRATVLETKEKTKTEKE